MITLYPADKRGVKRSEWLTSYHSFSFDLFHDPERMNYRSLRVLNEDTVEGGKGFKEHFHQEMEIMTYLLEGALEHRDSMGSVSTIYPGEVQCMSAGSGLLHSEYNLSQTESVHFLQIWFLPEVHGLDPHYEKRMYSSASKWGRWCLIGSRNGRDGSLRIHQDVDLWATLLEGGDELTFEALTERYYWIQILSGQFLIQKRLVSAGDGVTLEGESLLEVKCVKEGELLLFDLA